VHNNASSPNKQTNKQRFIHSIQFNSIQSLLLLSTNTTTTTQPLGKMTKTNSPPKKSPGLSCREDSLGDHWQLATIAMAAAVPAPIARATLPQHPRNL
jgi:hypothetical protein